ncbi:MULTISPECIES: hypothetical protein [unclassified Leucobacter]|uniref:hypothetical protein n=1 Tax=unclassified Leucobacter TaxID=2621730 RepID=UPI001E2EA5F8|nr:hypothetical protein [Leucobacter sp. Ag1]
MSGPATGPDSGAETAARALLARAALLRGRLPRVVLVDGRSGSGKTTIAGALVPLLGDALGAPAELLRVEDLYPGWDGLAAGAASVPAALRTGRYRRYDWIAGDFAEECGIERGRPLVIEGCGALSAENLAAARAWAAGSGAGAGAGVDAGARAAAGAVLPVWIELPADERRRRALARDGETFRPYWDRWASQEDALAARTHPTALAREILHGG